MKKDYEIFCMHSSLFPSLSLQEMKQLESHPMFNPAIKVRDVPQKEKKTLHVVEDKDDLSFNLFDQAAKAPPAEKGQPYSDNPKCNCTDVIST